MRVLIVKYLDDDVISVILALCSTAVNLKPNNDFPFC